MFWIKKFLTPFLVPPGIFIVLLILSGLWCLARKPRKTGAFQILIAGAMWFCALGPVSGTLLRGLEADYLLDGRPEGDVIVVLGGGISDLARDLSGYSVPSPESLQRIVAAVRLQKRLQLPVIASGGGFVHQRMSEAEVAQRYLIELGVPEKMILLEKKSRDTIESARFTQAICRSAGFRKPIVVTSGHHLKRVVMSFRKVGLEVVPFASGGWSEAREESHWTDLLPTDYRNIAAALKEYFGLLFYRIAY